MEKTELQLTENEYFQLEVHDWKIQEIIYKKQIASLKRDISVRDVAILQHNMERKKETQRELADEIQSLEIARLNYTKSKKNVGEAIAKRLDIEDEGWGYNPDTLMVTI